MVQVGDKVRFLNDVGGGKVTRIINKKLVDVENEDGFEIPTLISELVVIEPTADNYSRDKKVEAEKVAEPAKVKEPEPIFISGKDSPDFYLAFVAFDPVNPIGGEIEAWLVNDSNFSGLYHFSHYANGQYKSIKTGQIGSNSKVVLECFFQSDLPEFPEFGFQILYFSREAKELDQPVIKKIKVNPVKFYRESTFSPNSFFARNAWLLAISNNLMVAELDKLTESDIKKVVAAKEKEQNQPVTRPARKQEADLVEVDLHIRELIESTVGLSNAEILEIQIGRFRSEMETAIGNRAKRIVFIHGIGQGTLKAEILKELNAKYKKYYVQDASFIEYGYGATMVILRK